MDDATATDQASYPMNIVLATRKLENERADTETCEGLELVIGMASSSKRMRKANYSQEENLFLAEKYEEFKDSLDAKHKGASTNRQKKDTWRKIQQQFDARFPGKDRSVEDLKSRLSKLKSESRDRLSVYCKSRAATGGGEHPPEPTPAQQKILDICEGSPSFEGLIGVETGATSVAVSATNDNSDDGK